MDYIVRLEEDQQIVTATASGEWEQEKDNDMIRQVMETVDATGSRRVLIDIRGLHFNLPLIQIFERAKEMREQRKKYGVVSVRAAIVYSARDEKLDQDLQFFETAARNRGLPYRTFKDFEEAIAWLTE